MFKKLVTTSATVALLSVAMFSTPVMAESASGFSSLQGIEAQALSHQEMDAISGELNAYDIAAALNAKALTLSKYPTLQAAVVKLANYYTTNAAAINAMFAKFNILTPCTTCTVTVP